MLFQPNDIISQGHTSDVFHVFMFFRGCLTSSSRTLLIWSLSLLAFPGRASCYFGRRDTNTPLTIEVMPSDTSILLFPAYKSNWWVITGALPIEGRLPLFDLSSWLDSAVPDTDSWERVSVGGTWERPLLWWEFLAILDSLPLNRCRLLLRNSYVTWSG